jgi:hypothetical protein
MAHHRHALWDAGSLTTFGAHLAGSACQDTRERACDDGTTRATGTGHMDLARRALTMQARRLEASETRLRTWGGRHRLAGLGQTHGPQVSRMEVLASDGIVQAQIPPRRAGDA